MKVAILIAAFVVLTSFFSGITLSATTKNIAQTRMFLHLLGDRFTVKARYTPLWGEPTGAYQYRDRIYAVTVEVA